MKTCTKCGETKPLEQFYENKRQRTGYGSRCKDCHTEEGYRWQADNKDKYRKAIRKYQLKRKFGITPEHYDQLLEQQNHSCACCGKHQSELNRKLAVDHSHVTGEIRGLLCGSCNTAYGLLGDTEEGVLKLLDYSRRIRDIKGFLLF